MAELSVSARTLLWANIRQAMQANVVPAVFLQTLAVVVAVSYFHVPTVQSLFNDVAAFKAATGIVYSIVSTSFFGGILPFLYLFLSGQITTQPRRQLVFYVLFWASMGGIVDVFYQFQISLFGGANDWLSVVKKTLFDQFVFTVFFTCPVMTVIFIWKDCHFNWQATRAKLNRELFTLQIPTTLVVNWLIWIPAVSAIYLMPSALQVPINNLVLCCFVLLLAVLKR